MESGPPRCTPGGHPGSHHLFFAVTALPWVAQRADLLRGRIQQRYHLHGSKVRTERLHMTLLSLGWYDTFEDHLAAWAVHAADGVRMPAFGVRLDRCMSFRRQRGDRPLVLCGDAEGVAGFNALHHGLCDAVGAQGLQRAAAPGTPSITPHMTLLYSPGEVQPQPTEPLSFTVREFQLLHNRRGSPGPYQVLGRWTLGASRLH
jgi:2'-5' RNA ligase